MYTFREKLQDEVRRVIVNKNRDWRFELLRIIAMFLIVASHFYSADNWSVHTSLSLVKSWASAAHDSLAMLGQIGVSFFVLISAYFLAFNTKSPFFTSLEALASDLHLFSRLPSCILHALFNFFYADRLEGRSVFPRNYLLTSPNHI